MLLCRAATFNSSCCSSSARYGLAVCLIRSGACNDIIAIVIYQKGCCAGRSPSIEPSPPSRGPAPSNRASKQSGPTARRNLRGSKRGGKQRGGTESWQMSDRKNLEGRFFCKVDEAKMTSPCGWSGLFIGRGWEGKRPVPIRTGMALEHPSIPPSHVGLPSPSRRSERSADVTSEDRGARRWETKARDESWLHMRFLPGQGRHGRTFERENQLTTAEPAGSRNAIPHPPSHIHMPYDAARRRHGGKGKQRHAYLNRIRLL